jgi:4-amino-4-deoxy-L-arabinose transferase-like glycosyltransferase
VQTKIFIFIKKNRIIISLIILYFFVRLVNLTLLPIFNDESIYLDWGWREIHNPGYLYYSLYDGKQPLLMWIFGVVETLINDPLFAGRIVSVFAGFFTMCGIFYFAKKYFNFKTAIFSAVIYITIPLFSFYDRQALMESAVAASGIWSAVLFVNFIQKGNLKNSICLGIVLGLGIFIKSSALIFAVCFLVFGLFYLLKSNKKSEFALTFSITIVSLLLTIVLLLINPEFWSSFSRNSQYSLTLSEILKFPLKAWIFNFSTNFEITFFYITPVVLISFIFGVYFAFKNKIKPGVVFLVFFGFAFIITTLLTRVPLDRYIVSFFPFITLFAGYFIYLLINKNRILGLLFFMILLFIPILITSIQITNPPLYIQTMAKLSNNNQMVYLKGVTSGYGVEEAINFLNVQKKPFEVGVAKNTGNPESAILVYFNHEKDNNVMSGYMDGNEFGPIIQEYDCLRSSYPIYFVSREEQLTGLGKFFYKVKTFKNPYGASTTGLYILKQNCKGKTIDLTTKKN